MSRLIFFLSICIYYAQAAPDPTQLLKREAAPQPRPRLKLVKRETETEDSEEFTELEDLIVMIYIAHLIEIGLLDGDVLNRKARSVILKREAEPYPSPRLKLVKRETEDSEEFTELEDLIVMIYIAHLIEIGLLDDDVLNRKARSLAKRENSEEYDLSNEDWEELVSLLLLSLMENGSFEDDFVLRKARSNLLQQKI